MASTNIAQPNVSSPSGSVLWASTNEPPPGMAAYLRSEGLSLLLGEPPSSWPAPRLLSMQQRLPGKLRMLSFSGQRIAILHSDAAQATNLAQALRARSGEVTVMSGKPGTLDRIETFEPDVILVDIADFYGSCWHVVQALWQQPCLRWVPVVLTPPALATQGVSMRDLHLLQLTLQDLGKKRDELLALLSQGEPFDFPVNVLGPARTLRTLLSSGRSLCMSFTTKRIRLEIDIADHEVLAIRGGSLGRTDRILGNDALDWLHRREQGKVRVYPAEEHLPRISSVREIAGTGDLLMREDQRTTEFRARPDVGEPPTVVRLPARELAKAIEIVRAQIPQPAPRAVATLRLAPQKAVAKRTRPLRSLFVVALLASGLIAADAFSFTLAGVWERAWSLLLSL